MIEKYLVASCLSIIDDFNEKNLSIGMKVYSPELQKKAMDYSETDLTFRIGYFFGHRAEFERTAQKGRENGKNDIAVPSKDFRIEVKYLKPHKSNSGKNISAAIPWIQVLTDFSWLKSELLLGNKGKRAFIMGWFNTTSKFNQIMQIGKGGGNKPKMDPDKEYYFPFITYNKETRFANTVEYDYKNEIAPLSIKIPDLNVDMNCLFLGSSEDIFHLAIYY